ncbi:transcription factor Adf-1 [Manduca sexta]|uniref:MADF domain-containing protein n=1 Tax=Manduca sexta TaxID=7130 RepID=A0A921Z577_MANSE|nr:transcription factor Adf-1 [Manduca sexta]KAG6451343.1 hypothetical protein O3G_MSEX007080 [Manduca sexta]
MDKEALIEEISKYPFLYDMSDVRYSDTKKKDEAWKQIAYDMGEKEQNCRKTWFNLREAHRRSMKKKKTKGNETVQRKWIYEDQMAFLIPHYKERKQTTTDNEDYDVAQFLSMEDDSLNQAPSDSYSNPDSITSTPKKRFKTKTYKRKSEKETSVTTLLMEYLLEKKEKKDEEDEIDKFFSSMAVTVKKFPPMQQVIVKSKIFNFVSEMELDLLK